MWEITQLLVSLMNHYSFNIFNYHQSVVIYTMRKKIR